jgi:hypothetical protein
MQNRHRIVAVVGVVVTAVVLGFASPSRAADQRSYLGGSFAFSYAGTKAGFLASVADEGVKAEVVNEQAPNVGLGNGFCRLSITFFDSAGLILYSSELKVGPGEIGAVDLPAQQFGNGGLFHVTFQVLDEDKNGKIRPCLSLPSARVYDRQSGKTQYYLPIVAN